MGGLPSVDLIAQCIAPVIKGLNSGASITSIMLVREIVDKMLYLYRQVP